MLQDWAEGILLSELADEPELSEELNAICARFESGKGKDLGEDGGKHGGSMARHAVLNFEGVTYLNSSHLTQLLKLRKMVMEKGGKLILCCVNDEVWSMVLLTGLDQVFKFAADTTTALAMVQLDNVGS